LGSLWRVVGASGGFAYLRHRQLRVRDWPRVAAVVYL